MYTLWVGVNVAPDTSDDKYLELIDHLSRNGYLYTPCLDKIIFINEEEIDYFMTIAEDRKIEYGFL